MEQTVRSIIEQHPHGVAQLFSRYEVDADVTARNLQNAIKFFGDPFIHDLQAITKNNQVSSFLGLFESKEKREARKAKRLAEEKTPAKLPEIVDKGLGVLKLLIGGSTAEVTADDKKEETESRILGISKPIIVVLISVIVVLFLLRKR